MSAEDEFGWRVHAAVDSWTGKVDTKASIALAIESAIFGFTVTLTKKGSVFFGLEGADEKGFYLGLGLLFFAALFSLLVVLPQLRRCKSRKSAHRWETNTIYFGHLRHWEPEDLAKKLGSNSTEQLAEQLVAMSRIAWRKHSFLQISLLLLLGGVACLIVVATG